MSNPTHESIDHAERIDRKQSRSSASESFAKNDPTNVNTDVEVRDPEKANAATREQEDVSNLTKVYRRFRPFVLAAIAAVILGWWISSTVLEATRHRWSVFSPPSRPSPRLRLRVRMVDPCFETA